MKRILFIAPLHPNRSPSQRFRFEQYLDYIKQNGFEYKISYLITPKNDKIFYANGMLCIKFLLLIKFFFHRLKDLYIAKKYDIVFVQREAYYLGTTFFERMFSKRTKLIYDFDDSIWLSNVSDANEKFNWLKNPQKTSKIISYAHMVFAGNKYLAEYADKYNNNVKIIPTTIDTQGYKHLNIQKNTQSICIGWSGSITTIQHFKFAIPFLKIIKEKYGDKVYFKVIGDKNYINKELNIKGLPWSKHDELEQLSSFDIGVMPLPDDEWAKGKCGLKGLQYMALKIPTIMSPVGVNSEIIKDGINGFLAKKTDEWVEKISLLIDSEDLRKKIGGKGRQTVIEKYSFESQKQKYLNCFNELIEKK
jgi:glycosyltransferase involved in cell wall biosynthesis